MAFLNAKWVMRRPNVPHITKDEQEVFAEPSDSDFELPLGRILARLPNCRT